MTPFLVIGRVPVDASLRQHVMANDLLVVSLGRILADEVRVEPDEGHAVLQHLWQYLRGHRANDGGLPLIPALDRLGLTAFGDFQVRASATVEGVVRPPSQVARELADLLIRLVKSGRNPVDGAAARCLAVAQRTLTRETTSTARPITAPEGLLRALEAFRPRDASMSLAALFARWMRDTDTGRTAKSPAPALGLALGIGQPRAAVSTKAAARDTATGTREPAVDAAPRLLFAPAPAPAAPAARDRTTVRREPVPRVQVAARAPDASPAPERA
ncbi:MAG TPA: hypothetical protein VMF13_11815, partial [Luteitalea sp.]|nr:hypothetical protein [Luteitalea sp.]